MKKIYIKIILLIIGITSYQFSSAQTPQGMNYQAVARNAGGSILANQNISLRISITDGNGGFLLFQETHNAITTNQFGLFKLNIGNGTPVSGTFSSINWGSVTPWMQVELDAAGGTNYVLMGTSQLLSVPYAILAGGTGQWTTNGNDIYNANSGNIGIGTISPSSKLHLVGSLNITDGSQGAGKVLTSDANGLATWQAPAVPFETDPKVGCSNVNLVPKWNGTALVDGIISDDGTSAIVGTTAWLDDSKFQSWNTNHNGKALGVYGNNTSWGGPAAEFWNQGTGPTMSIDWAGSVSDRLVSFNNFGIEKGYIRTDGGAGFFGNVGVGTLTPTTNFHVNGNSVFGYDTDSLPTTNNRAYFHIDGGGIRDAAVVIAAHNCGSACAQQEPTTCLGLLNTNPNSVTRGGIGFLEEVAYNNNYAFWAGLQRTGAGTGDLLFKSGNAGVFTDRVVFKDNGNVGIGTTSPGNKLEVVGGATISGGYTTLCNSADNLQGNVGIGATPYTNVKLRVVGNQTYGVFIESALSSGQGGAALYVDGDAMKNTGGSSWIVASDARLKENINNYTDGLAQIMKINPVKYHYTEASGMDHTKEYIGVIAQDLKKVAPYMVGDFVNLKDNQEYNNVDNSAMTYMLINAVKELRSQLDAKQKQLDEITNRLEKLEK